MNLLDRAQTPTAGYVKDNLVRVFEDKRYAYDGLGRLIEKRAGHHTHQSFLWDAADRLVQVTTTRRPNSDKTTTQTTRYEYDALGRRVASEDAFGRTRFIWEGMRLIEERRQSKAVAYVYEPGGYVPLARIEADEAANDERETDSPPTPPTGSNILYFHNDPSGLPEELTDEMGRIRWRAAYKAWGNTLAESWEAVGLDGRPLREAEAPEGPQPISQNLRYQGQYLDRDTGLHYNTFRFYDPDIGRFISPDPIGLNGGLNLYSYAPNPVAWIDPWGWSADGLIRYKPRPELSAQSGARSTAIDRAWVQEKALVQAGGGTRNWTPQERNLITSTPNKNLTSVMSREGYTGHHINSVEGWAAAGFEDTLLRWNLKPEGVHGYETAVQPRIQA